MNDNPFWRSRRRDPQFVAATSGKDEPMKTADIISSFVEELNAKISDRERRVNGLMETIGEFQCEIADLMLARDAVRRILDGPVITSEPSASTETIIESQEFVVEQTTIETGILGALKKLGRASAIALSYELGKPTSTISGQLSKLKRRELVTNSEGRWSLL